LTKQEFSRKQGTISDSIIWLVKNHPDVTEDYRKLFIYYWYYLDGLNLFVPKNLLMGLTQPESIGRAFRKLVADGHIVVDEKTKRARLAEEQNFRRYYGPKDG